MMEIFSRKLNTPLVIHVSQSLMIKASSVHNISLQCHTFQELLESKVGKDSTFEVKIMTVLQNHLNLQ